MNTQIQNSQRVQAQGNNNFQSSHDRKVESQIFRNGSHTNQPDRISDSRQPQRDSQYNQYNDQYQNGYVQFYNQNNSLNDYQRNSYHNKNDSPQKQSNQLQIKYDQSINGLKQSRSQAQIQQSTNLKVNAAPYRQEQLMSQGPDENTQYVDHLGENLPIEADRLSSYELKQQNNSYNLIQNTQYDVMQDDKVKRAVKTENDRQQTNYSTNSYITRTQANPKIIEKSQKQRNKIFSSPSSSNLKSPNQIGIGINSQQPVSYNSNNLKSSQEMGIYGPGDNNKTTYINPDQSMTMQTEMGRGQQASMSPFKNQNNIFFNNTQNAYPYYQGDQKRRNIGGSNQVGYASGNYQSYPQGYGYNSRIPERYPPIIENFKRKDIQLERQLDFLYSSTNTDQNIPIQLNIVKKMVEEKIEFCLDSVNQIKNEKNDILNSFDKSYKDNAENEHIFSTEQMNQYKTSLEKMEKAIECLKAQKGAVDSNKNRIQRQIKQCTPEIIQQPIYDLDLDKWIQDTLDVLHRIKNPFTTKFDDSSLKYINSNGFTKFLSRIGQQNEQNRLQAIHEQANETNNEDLQLIYELMSHLNYCEHMLNQISIHIDSAVFIYAELIDQRDQDLTIIGSQINFYVNIIHESIVNQKTLQSYAIELQKMSSNSSELSKNVFQQNLLFPNEKHLEQNKRFLKSLEEKKDNQVDKISRYISLLRDKQSYIHQQQKIEGVPYILTTPFDWEVINLSQQAEQMKKRIQMLDPIIQAFLSLEQASTKPISYYKSNQEWFALSQRRQMTSQESKQKVEEIQRQIIELLELRDSLGMHHVKQSYPELYKEICNENQRLSEYVTKIQDLQSQIVKSIDTPIITKGDNSFAQASIQSQQQKSSMVQIMITGSYNALPSDYLKQTKKPQNTPGKNSPVKDSPYSHPENLYQNTEELEKFNKHVDKTRELLKSNAHRQDILIKILFFNQNLIKYNLKKCNKITVISLSEADTEKKFFFLFFTLFD